MKSPRLPSYALACVGLLLPLLAASSHGAPAKGPTKRSVAAIPSSMPSQVSVTLANGEGIHLHGNVAVAIYRDGPLEPTDPTRSTPEFLQRRLGEMRSTSFLVSEETRVRFTLLVLNELRSSESRRLPLFTSSIRVSTFYSSSQTGGESRLDSAYHRHKEHESASLAVLLDLVERVLESHRHDDGL
jgi:hypothetical protein